MFWDSKLECRIFGFSRNHIDLVFEVSRIDSWRLSCLYGIPDRNRRKESWNFLRALSKLSSIPWCVVGDFNDMLYVEDKEGVHPHPHALLEGFGRAVNDCELLELDLCGGRFTWEKSRDSDKWVQEKLDRAFATISWWDKFPLCKLNLLVAPVSDHNPIHLVLFDISIPKKIFRFRFENVWLREPSFVKETTEFWKQIPVTHLMLKLKEVSKFMGK